MSYTSELFEKSWNSCHKGFSHFLLINKGNGRLNPQTTFSWVAMKDLAVPENKMFYCVIGALPLLCFNAESIYIYIILSKL